MRWKLTLRYVFSVLVIVSIVIVINLVILIGLVVWQQQNNNKDLSANDGETFTREFSKYLSIENEQPVVSDEGKQALQQLNGSIQFLDDEGFVIDSLYTDENTPTHYTPLELIHLYKYLDETKTTYYISEFDRYSYLIGMRDADEERIVFMFNGQAIFTYLSKAFSIIVIADIIIAILIGLFFSSVITKPISLMIHRINLLRERDFQTPSLKRTGIFKSVFSNLNNVSKTLEAHEAERTKLEKIREEWISNVSHDLKTPLASIQGFSELLKDEELGADERSEYASIVEKKSIYMKELLDDFNLTMRLRHDEMPLTFQNTKIESFVHEIIIDLLNEQTSEERDISFESQTGDTMWLIDHHLMKRAILNFIDNAIFHNEKDISIQIHLTADTLVIEDNGKGISEDDQEYIFDRYYRGTNTESETNGTGLGMAIARDIIEAHGGTVTLQSKFGKGTKICIQMPSEDI